MALPDAQRFGRRDETVELRLRYAHLTAVHVLQQPLEIPAAHILNSSISLHLCYLRCLLYLVKVHFIYISFIFYNV